MTIEFIRHFYRATDPGKPLFAQDPEDQKLYIDFSEVRGGQIIEELKDNISFFSPDSPTCSLFTGHIGCGKSTELLRLKLELEQEGFHLVYFESSEDLEMADVDIGEVLLAIARQVSQSLTDIALVEPRRLKEFLAGALEVLNSEVTGIKLKIPGLKLLGDSLGDVGMTSDKDKFSLYFGIGEITTRTKSDARLRERLNRYLGPQKNQLVDAINQELLEPAIASLKAIGKNGLVVIVDNLDRLDSRPKDWGRPQPEYLFVDQGDCLNRLNCHVVYTMPLGLKFSKEYGNLTQRFTDEPKVLPMVSVKRPDGEINERGMQQLRQMILVRAFPNLSESEQIEKIPELFENAETLDRLCAISGGHVRDILSILNAWIRKHKTLPLLRETLEAVIRSRRNEMMMAVSDADWELLRQVRQRKKVSGIDGYEKLINSRLVFEYRQNQESWFDINPLLAEAKEMQD